MVNTPTADEIAQDTARARAKEIKDAQSKGQDPYISHTDTDDEAKKPAPTPCHSMSNNKCMKK